jgi:hypothetical protein
VGPSDVGTGVGIVLAACGNLFHMERARCQYGRFDAKLAAVGFCDMEFLGDDGVRTRS